MQNYRPLKIGFFIALTAFLVLFFNPFASVSQTAQALSESALQSFSTEKAQAAEPGAATVVTQMLSDRTHITQANNQWIFDINNLAKGIFNVIALLALIFVAFNNILRHGENNYQIKAMLPKLILAAVLANLSLPIFALASRFVDSLGAATIFAPKSMSGFTIFSVTSNMFSTIAGAFGVSSITGIIVTMLIPGVNLLTAAGLAIVLIVVILLILLPQVIIISALTLLMTVRPWVIYLCAAIAPVAIATSVLPFTQAAYKRWLNIALIWLTFPLVVNAIIWVADKIPAMGGASGGGVVDGMFSSLIGLFLPTIIKLGLAFLAIKYIFITEKDISGLVAKTGGFLGKAAWTGIGTAGSKLYTMDVANKDKVHTENYDKNLKALKGTTKAGKKAHYMKAIERQAKRDEFEGGYDPFNAEHSAKMTKIKADASENFDKSYESRIRSAAEAEVRKDPAFKGLKEDAIKKEIDDRTATESAKPYTNKYSAAIEQEINNDLSHGIASNDVSEEYGKKRWLGFIPTRQAIQLGRRINPYGAFIGMKFSQEIDQKNREKEVFRESRVTKGFMSEVAKIKKSKEIHGDDMAQLYSTDALNASAFGPAKNELLQNVAKDFIKKDSSLSQDQAMRQAAAYLNSQLSHLQNTAGSDFAYKDLFDRFGFTTAHDQAAVIKGFDRGQNLAASEARSPLNREVILARKARATERMLYDSGGSGETGSGRTASTSAPSATDRKMLELMQRLVTASTKEGEGLAGLSTKLGRLGGQQASTVDITTATREATERSLREINTLTGPNAHE